MAWWPRPAPVPRAEGGEGKLLPPPRPRMCCCCCCKPVLMAADKIPPKIPPRRPAAGGGCCAAAATDVDVNIGICCVGCRAGRNSALPTGSPPAPITTLLPLYMPGRGAAFLPNAAPKSSPSSVGIICSKPTAAAPVEAGGSSEGYFCCAAPPFRQLTAAGAATAGQVVEWAARAAR